MFIFVSMLVCVVCNCLPMYALLVWGEYFPSVPHMQDQIVPPPHPPPPPPQAAAHGPTDAASAAAAFEVEGPSLKELLERPIQRDGKVLISSTQLKQLAVLLDNPVGISTGVEGESSIALYVRTYYNLNHVVCTVCVYVESAV